MKRTVKQIVKDALSLLWKDVKDAKWVIIFIIAYFAFLGKFLYSVCPVVLLTGFPCPACGLTRAGVCLLQLDFAGAFRFHPFIYPIGGLMVLFCVNRYILQKKAGEWLKWCAIVLIISMVLFYIYRMVNEFPGEPPMSYYAHSYCNSIFHMIK